MSHNQEKINISYLDSIGVIQATVVSANTNGSKDFELESSDNAGESTLEILVGSGSIERIVIFERPELEVLIITLDNANPENLTIVVKNCPALKYLQLPERENGTGVSIVLDKSLSQPSSIPSNEDVAFESEVHENLLPNGLFVNGLISELLVLWAGAKRQSLARSHLNAVTHESKLLPSEYVNDEQWEAGGGVWLYDLTETFLVEPEVVFADSTIMDSAYIGQSLSHFDFNELFVDAVVVDSQLRSNPSVRRSNRQPRSMLVEREWTVPFKVLYLNGEQELNTCQTAIFGDETCYLHLGNAKGLSKVITNSQPTSRLDLSHVDNLKAIEGCGIGFIGISNSEIEQLDLVGGVLNTFYTFNSSIDRVKCDYIKQYFLMGKGRDSELQPDVLVFEFASDGTERSNPYSSRAKRSIARRNPAIEPIRGYQDTKKAIQSTLLGLESQPVYSIVPQSGTALTYLIHNFYQGYLQSIHIQGTSIPSYSDVIKPYINGAGQAIAPAECQFSVIFLHQTLSFIFDLYAAKGDVIPSSMVDAIWESRQSTLKLNSGQYTVKDGAYIPTDMNDNASWVWDFPRDDSNPNPSLGLYQDAWLCDLGLIIYTILLGGDRAQKQAQDFCETGLATAYAPIQLFAMLSFFGSLDVKKYILRSLYKYFEVLKKNNRSDEIEPVLVRLRGINSMIGEKLVESMSALPFSYENIRLAVETITAGKAPVISSITFRDLSSSVNPSSRLSSYYLMRNSNSNGLVGNGYAFRFNAFMIEELLNVFKYGTNRDRYWTNEFSNERKRSEILDSLVKYLNKLPVDLHAYINAESLIELEPERPLDDFNIAERAIAQGYQDHQVAAIQNAAAPGLTEDDDASFKHDAGARFRERLADVIFRSS